MSSFFLPSGQRRLWTLLVCTTGLLLIATGCDFGAAKNAVESVSPTISLTTTKTTVSGRAVETTSGALVSNSADLRLKGPNSDALVDMYGDPISATTLYSGAISLSVRGNPSPNAPIQFQVVATADGYHSTSESVHITSPGAKQFRLDMLSEDPTRQPEGAFGIRTEFDRITEDGTVEARLTTETPSTPAGGSVGLTIPDGTVLQQDGGAADAPITVDLVHYSLTEETLDALPGDGVLEANADPQRFSAIGYLNQEVRTAGTAPVSDLQAPNGTTPATWVRLSDEAVAPSSGTSIQEGDELDLFRFNPDTGTWRPETTVTVQSLPASAGTKASSAAAEVARTRGGKTLGIRWPLQISLQSRWWAWGQRSRRSCTPSAAIQVNPNGQFGNVEVRLRRHGLQYTRSVSMDALNESDLSLATLLGQSTMPRHGDYSLTLRTRDGQSRTVGSVNPCSGTQSVSLPAPNAPGGRTDVLLQALPTCPANQHVRITSAPKVMVYYRELGTDGWNTAGSDRITWVMDDPKSPTYIKRAELTLDGLKHGREYEFTTTYGHDQYGATVTVPQRSNATIHNGRAVVTYDRPLPNVCS